jgi:hypothetical protein
MVLLKLFDSTIVLRAFGMGALLCLTAALFGPATVSRFSFACIRSFALPETRLSAGISFWAKPVIVNQTVGRKRSAVHSVAEAVE